MAGQCSQRTGYGRKITRAGKGRAMDERYMQTDAEISENLCQDDGWRDFFGDNVPEMELPYLRRIFRNHTGRLLCHRLRRNFQR